MGIKFGNTDISKIKIASGLTPRLPSAYQEVEWIGCDSSGPYIDTGVLPKDSTLSQIKFMNLAVTGYVIYGMYNGDDNTSYRLFNYQSTIYFDLKNVRSYTGTGNTLNPNTLYEFEVGNNYVKNVGASSNLITGTTVSSYTGNTNIMLNGNNSGNISRNRWYYVKIWEGDTQVRDFIPCYRIADDVIGMYDLVNGVFYTNAGSGTFTKGADVNLPYKEIKKVYLGSTQVRPSVVTETYTMVAKTQSSGAATDYTAIYKSGKTIKEVVIETTFNKVGNWANSNFGIATDSTSSNSFYLNSNGIGHNNYCEIQYSVNGGGLQTYRSGLSGLNAGGNNTVKFTIGRDSAILELNGTTNSYTYGSSEATFVQGILDSATAQFIYNFTASEHGDVTITVTYN